MIGPLCTRIDQTLVLSLERSWEEEVSHKLKTRQSGARQQMSVTNEYVNGWINDLGLEG